MATRTVKLTFRGPVHLGQGRLSDSGYSCDAATLFSALFIEALRMGSSDELLEAARSGELGLSDAFPYIENKPYLPKPMLAAGTFDAQNSARESLDERLDSRQRKANKRLAYIPAAHYAGYLSGTFDAVTALEGFDLGKASLQTRVNLTREDSEDSLPYFVGGYTFSPGSGLYFISTGDYDIAPILEQLSYSGLGGKRTSGYGRFEYSIENSSPLGLVRNRADKAARGQQGVRDARLAAEKKTEQKTRILLSSALPRCDELSDDLLDGARYRLVRRGGFIQSTAHSGSPQKKRDMYVFAAGSTFERSFEGDIYDVNATPGSHPVWRYARAMWMEV